MLRNNYVCKRLAFAQYTSHPDPTLLPVSHVTYSAPQPSPLKHLTRVATSFNFSLVGCTPEEAGEALGRVAKLFDEVVAPMGSGSLGLRPA